MNYKWDLEKIIFPFPNFIALKKELFNKQNDLIELLKKNPLKSEVDFEHFNNETLNITVLFNKVHNYISNNMNVNLNNTEWFALNQEITNRSINFYTELSNWKQIVLDNEEIIKGFLDKKDSLKKLKVIYERTFRTKKYQLLPEVKKYAISYTPLGGSFYSIFSLIFDSELTIKPAEDSEGKEYIINNYSDFKKYIKHPDRTLRKNVYINWVNGIYKLRETFARLMYFNFLEANIDAKNRNFKNGSYEEAIFDDEISDSLIPFIYKQIASLSSHVSKFQKIRKNIIKKNYEIEDYADWDSYLEITKKDDNNYSIDDCKTIILNALSILGSEYKNIVNLCFSDNSIDWLPCKNKLSGAYCIGNCFGIDSKYLLLNFQNKLDDILTVGHELGHAVHAHKFCKSQTYYAATTIFIAEIPSILNEILINYYLLNIYKKENNLFKQLEIYDSLIKNFIATTSSQAVFSSWEKEINEEILNNKLLSADLAEEIYLNKHIEFFGKPEEVVDHKKLTKILTVPHFYGCDFYVYKYIIGMVVATYISEMIIDDKERENICKKYNEFLESGDSRSNLETIKLLGIDLEDQKLWDYAKNTINKWVNEWEKIYNAIYS